jgi:rhodanese-related sulfurtransferase
MMKTVDSFYLNKHRKDILLIDVREGYEHKNEHIEGSVLIPLSKISFDTLPAFSGEIVLYCAIGKRSMVACQKLLAEDENLDVASLLGGIESWKSSGFYAKKKQNF